MKFADRVLASVKSHGLEIAAESLSVVCDRTTTALRDITVTIPPESYLGIEGLNGSGKSTFANAILGLGGRTLAVTGKVTYNGHDIYGPKVSDRDRTVLRSRLFGYVPKVPSLDPSLTVEANILRSFRLSGTQFDPSTLDRLLADFGLSENRRQPTRELSSGFQQRVNIVRGLLADVPAVVLDEPTDALDPGNKEFALTKLREHATGRTVLVVSHERTGASHSIRLHGGRLVLPT